jgi:hypothetical protein
MPEIAGMLGEIEAAADILVAAGRRGDAIAWVEEAGGNRALLLLARLHLGRGTVAGAKAAMDALVLWRMAHREDLEALTLMRRAVVELGFGRAAREIDREICWLIAPRGKRPFSTSSVLSDGPHVRGRS